MRYIQLDQDGKVMAHFANKQPGYAEIPVNDDHPLILEFNEKRKPKKAAIDRAAILDRMIDEYIAKNENL